MKQCHDEVYLGKNRFANELHHSFNEFMANVVGTLGFCTLKVGYLEDLVSYLFRLEFNRI